MTDKNVVDFTKASDKLKHKRVLDDKEAKIADMRQRFANALPDKPTPVKDYLKKKRAKKKQ